MTQHNNQNRPAHPAGRNNNSSSRNRAGALAQNGLNGGGNASAEVHAPFNFVPLANWVLTPEWDAQASQDKPFADGVSGTLDIEIIARTPLLVGEEQIKPQGNQPGQVRFNKLPDKRYAIPGTSLRGMLRNVLEIATFSRMRFVDDQRFSIRDLNNKEVYGKKLTEEVRSRVYKPQSHSGWLRFENGCWYLYPCTYARVEQTLIDAYAGTTIGDNRQVAEGKYKQILLDGKTLSVKYQAGAEIEQTGHSCGTLIYSKVTSLKSGNSGYLVVTGQPIARQYNNVTKLYTKNTRIKHMEFVFAPPTEKKIGLDDRVMQDFLFIHRNTDPKKSNEWDYLKKNNKELFPECGIPVFYLLCEECKSVRAMGLAQMFKLAYTNSVHDMIKHTDKTYTSDDWDFVETLFGHVSDKLEQTNKGRVSLGYAVCTTGEVEPVPQQATILSSPKPSYYPNYVKQYANAKNKVIDYKTYMDADAEISGWKRYPVRPKFGNLIPQGKADQAGNDMKVVLNPLPMGTKFTGKLRFHNLKPQELGALIWALEWGGDKIKCHALGMGKPFGFGQVSIEIDGGHIIPNDIKKNVIDTKENTVELDKYRSCFVDYMEKQYALQLNLNQTNSSAPRESKSTAWSESVQMKQLLAMADPSNANGKKLEYMKLGRGNDNEFVTAKNNKYALPLYDESSCLAQETASQKTPDEESRWEKASIRFNGKTGH